MAVSSGFGLVARVAAVAQVVVFGGSAVGEGGVEVAPEPEGFAAVDATAASEIWWSSDVERGSHESGVMAAEVFDGVDVDPVVDDAFRKASSASRLAMSTGIGPPPMMWQTSPGSVRSRRHALRSATMTRSTVGVPVRSPAPDTSCVRASAAYAWKAFDFAAGLVGGLFRRAAQSRGEGLHTPYQGQPGFWWQPRRSAPCPHHRASGGTRASRPGDGGAPRGRCVPGGTRGRDRVAPADPRHARCPTVRPPLPASR